MADSTEDEIGKCNKLNKFHKNNVELITPDQNTYLMIPFIRSSKTG